MHNVGNQNLGSLPPPFQFAFKQRRVLVGLACGVHINKSRGHRFVFFGGGGVTYNVGNKNLGRTSFVGFKASPHTFQFAFKQKTVLVVLFY